MALGGSSAQAKLALLPLKRMINESVLNRLISSCQLKFLNYFLVSVVHELSPAYAVDNEHYLCVFIAFCNP